MSMKIKLLRKLTKRPYGMARFRVGRTWYSKIVRFDRDACEWYGGKYIFNRNAITIEKNAGTRKVYDARDWIDNEDGYPVIYFDVNSAIPIKQVDDPTSKGNLPGSKAIQATIKKEIAAFEAEMLRKQKSKLMTAIIITLVFSMGALFVGLYTLIKMGDLQKAVETVPGAVETIKTMIVSRP